MQPCYFDHNATTPVDPRVVEAMLPHFGQVYGNASSLHRFGQEARKGVERARRQIAARLGCSARDIVFTSGGTEADNLAVFGTVRGAQRRSRHVITSQIEHPAVLNACERLEAEGVDVTYLPAGSDGLVSPDDVRAALRPDTVLVTIMHANNELGTLQPVREISRIAREAGIPLHSDGVQSFGKVATRVKDLGVDMFSLSAHKIYGPKGVGALYIRRGLQVEKVQYGGSHERDRRPGTENVPGIVGLGAAAELAGADLDSEADRVGRLRDRMEDGILARIGSAHVHARTSPRLPTTSSVRFDHVESEPLLISLDLSGYAVSSGSACSSGAVEPSHVLSAIGLSRLEAKSTLRFSLGRATDSDQVDSLLRTLPGIVERLRALSPAWEGAA
ncbi:MAG: cysteine desulfurase family protein [Bryobacterales bacterium]|nr:cysteine desulfurase family protein [Bryobacterales bacterium]